MEIHICKEDPCPLQDKELYDMLCNGFKTEFTTDDKSVAQLYFKLNKSDVAKWVGSVSG